MECPNFECEDAIVMSDTTPERSRMGQSSGACSTVEREATQSMPTANVNRNDISNCLDAAFHSTFCSPIGSRVIVRQYFDTNLVEWFS